jgi:hypothetical protein
MGFEIGKNHNISREFIRFFVGAPIALPKSTVCVTILRCCFYIQPELSNFRTPESRHPLTTQHAAGNGHLTLYL